MSTATTDRLTARKNASKAVWVRNEERQMARKYGRNRRLCVFSYVRN